MSDDRISVTPRDQVLTAQKFTPDTSVAWMLKWGMTPAGKNSEGKDYFTINGGDGAVFYGYWILTDSTGNHRAIPSGNINGYQKVVSVDDGDVES